jgi:hypothetical protein
MPRSPNVLFLALAACGSGGGFPDAPPPDRPVPTGTFSVAWSVVDQSSQPIPCDRIAAQVMTVLTHNLAFEGGSAEAFSCATGMGKSQGLAPGRYEMDFELSGTFGTLARGAKQVPVTIRSDENVELVPVTFQVEALGAVALQLSAGQPGGNCGAVGAGGAGIDQVSITLEHSGTGSCEPITLSISDGATQPGGTYTIDCATPVDRACIEADQVLSASQVPSDSYKITVRGKVAGKVCWLNGDTIQVPPLNKVLQRTLNLARQTQTPGC